MNSYISRICFSLLITLALSSFMVGCANDKPAMTDEVVSQHVVITLHEKKVNIDQLVPYQYTYKVEFLSDLLKIGTEKEEKKRYYVLERIGTLFRPRNYFSIDLSTRAHTSSRLARIWIQSSGIFSKP